MSKSVGVDESEEWVRCLENGEYWYCFNRRTRETSSIEVHAAWSGQWDENGDWYYWRIDSPDHTMWDLPEFGQAQKIHEASKEHDSQAKGSTHEEVTEVWAQMMGHVTFYYHREKRLVLDGLPPGVVSRWVGYQDQDEGWRYEDTGRTSKEAPPSQSPWIEIGAPVCICGLTKKVHFNWQIATLVDFLAGWCLLRHPDSSNVFALRPDKVEKLPIGSLVELQRLNSADLNGCIGIVQGHNFEAMRYNILLDDGREKAVCGVNLKTRRRLIDIGAKVAKCSSSGCLQWRGELICQFLDMTGRRRNYALHLPVGFDPTSSSLDGITPKVVKKWPLMIYMHGTGGGSFFTYSKKSLNSAGMKCAAHQFVVVSPRCEWTWRETPSGWIAELVKSLRVLDWIDHERVYLTGCSMGGMGAWEVGAQNADLFAAVCPVAAHHKSERTALIAHGLKSKPVYVVHADTDDTCPMSQEECLWRLLEDDGHQDFTKVILHNVDHCSIHEHAFCFNEEVYRWFLQRTLSHA